MRCSVRPVPQLRERGSLAAGFLTGKHRTNANLSKSTPGATRIYFRDPDGSLAELISPGFWATY